MNEINAAQRKRVAAQELAEADKIKIVTAAEAEAEAERMADRVEEVFAGEIGRLAEAVVHRDVQGRAQRVDLL